MKFKSWLSGAVMVWMGLGLWPAWAVETVRVGGSGTPMPVLRQLAELYRKSHPDVQIEIADPPIGSRAGMRAVKAGKLDLALSVQRPKPEDQTHFAPPLPWVVTPIVLAGRDVKGRVSFSLQQLADIYAGRLTQWPNGQPIRLVLRSADVSDITHLRALSPQLDVAIAQALQRNTQPVAEDVLDILKMLERTPHSLGTLTLGLIRSTGSKLQPVAIAGVMPSLQSVQDGSYPLSKTLLLVTARHPSKATAEFVAFLRSAEADQLLRRMDYALITP